MFVKTVPEAIAAAASQLEGIGTSFAAESSAAAAPTTALPPAASDEVSILQAGVFSTYGQLYQTVSAQAQAIHQQFVNLLGTSANSYGATEAANQVAAASASLSNAAASGGSATAQSGGALSGMANVINNIANFLSGSGPTGASSGFVTVPMAEAGNFASAYSDVIGMGGGGMLTALSEPVVDFGGLSAGLVSSVSPAAAAETASLSAAPVLAGIGQAPAIGALSVPPSWAAAVPATSTPVTLAAQSWTTAAPPAGGTPGLPGGMPAVASAGRGGSSFGAPRYGVKPKVMPTLPKPTIT
ncbi:PE domain-containing protein [Mycobacterium sp.]|uniref:PPE family protein, SVP subgroup n=1 Tax=Mycobacterium sp. TaxID=1785 RepID=UPI0012736D70|nr:PE domain-containing protein [Mycobacterium sp.]KAA8964274.1 MAG: PE domain-containing protein [Mycobacterium sp.]